ncbi:hypothetical protein RHSIM_Rhsim01G0008600 [Rhododendron simsii]|uniref:xylose isomerase n=1 Tax=Rhododendron simsii TaxID=118357 RepID=A0A834HH71_RHOSS|nr:hypothetical protein RHSIM_RhsimUnG0079500 [Rhododendron simsii]KAF7154054.1 hypothetical protein RHSIM_Rhsim01G0008600 [Rhododendron simsii]
MVLSLNSAESSFTSRTPPSRWLLMGPSSKNPLAVKWYNAQEEILGKKMKDWMRFSVAFWHTFCGTGGDPFGAPTKMWPWEDGTNSVAMAKTRLRANFEFIEKLGVDFWCFHDRDIAPDGKTLEVYDTDNAPLKEKFQAD